MQLVVKIEQSLGKDTLSMPLVASTLNSLLYSCIGPLIGRSLEKDSFKVVVHNLNVLTEKTLPSVLHYEQAITRNSNLSAALFK